jgi:CRP-like cAMP-binding protein
MDTEIIVQLKKLELFQDTPEHLLSKIASQTRILELEKGDVLARQDDPSDSLFVIRRGWVKIVTERPNGEEVVLNQCGPGQIIGEMSLLDQQPRSNSMIVLSSAKLLEIKYSVVLETIEANPKLAISFLSDMSNRLRFANAYIQEAVEWCHQIAAGNYDFVEQQVAKTQSTIIDMTRSNEARAGAFLSSFFKMVKDIRDREEDLKRQVQELKIQIDEAKREQAVKELTSTGFFTELQAAAQRLRGRRNPEIKRPSEEGGEEKTK